MDLRRENRILRIALVILFGCVAAGVTTRGNQTQRLPGPGTGVVDVSLVNDAKVKAAQHGEWRVAQQGEWRVGVQGTVATVPSLPPFLSAGGQYEIRWPGRDPDVLTLREVHPSGWAHARTGDGRSRWVNLTTAMSIEDR